MNEQSREANDTWREIKDVLDEELDRLPEKYRLPIILFHLEGHSLEEISELLAVNGSTVDACLARGRSRLRARLARRGISMALAGLMASLGADVTSAAVPVTFVTTATDAATLFAAGKVAGSGVLTAKTAALAKGAMNMLTIAKLKMAAAVMVTATAVSTSSVFVYQAAVQAEPQVPMPTVVLPEHEMPVRLVYAYDRVQHRGEKDGSVLPPVEMSLVTVARLPENVWQTMSSHVTNRTIALEPAVAGKDVGVLLVSPNLETGKFWRPARVHRDGNNIVLVAESWSDNQVRKSQNPPRQSMYFVSLGKLEPGAYSLTLHVRDMYCDFDKGGDPHYTERSIQTASTKLHVAEPQVEIDKVDGTVALPTIAAKDLVALPGSGKAYQMATGQPPSDVDAKVNPHVAVGRPAEAIQYLMKHDDVGAMIPADIIHVDSYANTKPFHWRTAAAQPPTAGLPVWLRVSGPHSGLKDELSVCEIEWIGDKKVVIRLDSWRSDRDEHPRAWRQGVAFLPLTRGLLPIRDPGEYQVQVEWNVWYDKEGEIYTRYTAKDIEKGDNPAKKKDEFKELLTRRATHKFTIQTADARFGDEDPTARRQGLLKQDTKSFRLTLKSYPPGDKPGQTWLEVIQQWPPQSGAPPGHYLKEEQVTRLVDGLAREGFLRKGTFGEADRRQDTPWILRIDNDKFVQHQVVAEDKVAETTRQALLKLVAQATAEDKVPGDAAKIEQNGLAMTVKPAKATFAADEPLSFHVTLQNTSEKPFMVFDADYYVDSNGPWKLTARNLETGELWPISQIETKRKPVESRQFDAGKEFAFDMTLNRESQFCTERIRTAQSHKNA